MTVKIKVKKANSFVGTEPIATLNKVGVGTKYDRLDKLKDVSEGYLPQDGSTLVYDQETDKYIVKKLTFEDMDDILDGGQF